MTTHPSTLLLVLQVAHTIAHGTIAHGESSNNFIRVMNVTPLVWIWADVLVGLRVTPLVWPWTKVVVGLRVTPLVWPWTEVVVGLRVRYPLAPLGCHG